MGPRQRTGRPKGVRDGQKESGADRSAFETSPSIGTAPTRDEASSGRACRYALWLDGRSQWRTHVIGRSHPHALVIGATRPTGREVLSSATREGWTLRAMARKPRCAGVCLRPARNRARRDDGFEFAEDGHDGVEVVICLLGTPLTLTRVDLLVNRTDKHTAAMRAANVGRLICVTGMGAGDSRGHGCFLYDRVIASRARADLRRQGPTGGGCSRKRTRLAPRSACRSYERSSHGPIPGHCFLTFGATARASPARMWRTSLSPRRWV